MAAANGTSFGASTMRMRGAGLALLMASGLMLSGCVAAGVASLAAGAGLGVTLGMEDKQTAEASKPTATDDTAVRPTTASETVYVESSETGYVEEPTPLVQPLAPVEAVESQPIQ